MPPVHMFQPHHHVPGSTDMHLTCPHPVDTPRSMCIHVHVHSHTHPSPMTSHALYPRTNVSQPPHLDSLPWIAPRPHLSLPSPAPWPHMLPTTRMAVFMNTSRRCVVGNRCIVWFRCGGCRCIGCSHGWCRHRQVTCLMRSDHPWPSPTRPNPR